ncbi:AraC-type DNA-binding protein [Parapedobacter composti]|uniref:AraC-type DNA-binding protein n=1 Tax=Parapedobacter composti TaxID=623281 RepID=A0A1I1LA15_9SPHI|nr:AraC family transcriptional regulator [Parapedobacter composti]SFC66390.1 AraC-type DNA-binding protein [Parapedobacter composti]
MKPIYAKPPIGNRAAFQVRKDYLDVLDTKWHYHSEFELAYISYPYGKRIAGNSVALFEDDDLVFYGPNFPHAWAHEPKEGGEQSTYNNGLSHYAIVVHFSASCFDDSFFSIPEMVAIQTVLQRSARGLLVYGESRQRIAQWMKELLEHTGAKRVILLLQILEELSRTPETNLLSSAGYWDNLNEHDMVRMSGIYEYITQNFTKDIALEDIAAQAHISPSAFCRYFKARTKRTLKEFVNDLRINYACQLLEENRHSITQICFEAGFNNISNFNRRFKEMKGITPQQYRMNIRNIYNKVTAAPSQP